MKKLLSVFLTVLLVFAAVTVIAGAADTPEVYTGITKDGDIYCTNLLDFNKATNELWAQYDEATGKWSCKIDWKDTFDQPKDADDNPIAPVLRPYSSFSAHKWSLSSNGEVFQFESTDSSIYPGISFGIDQAHSNVFAIGKESSDPKKAEYVKIRIKNYSSCDQMTFAFVLANTNNGNFVNATISELTVDENGKQYGSSGEWETYMFSMSTINQNTNYEELLYDPTNEKDTPKSRWGGSLYELLVFPFGYDVSDGTGNYPGAKMDIDYIVIGSKNYVENYQSALEIEEGNVQSIALKTAPNKTTYRIGEAFESAGLEVEATLKDGSKKTYKGDDIGVNISTFESVVNELTLSIGQATCTMPITITPITSIEVVKSPEDNVFEVAELADGFVSDGYQVKVNFADGTSKLTGEGGELSNSSFSFTGDFSTVGKKTVTVVYFGQKTSFEITTVQVTDIEVTAPTKNYRYNSKTSAEDFGYTFVYNDGSKVAKADASIEFEYALECATKTPGKTVAKITATAADYGLTFVKEVEIEIENPTGVEVTKPPKKVEYQPGDPFVATGMTVSLVYADGSKVTVDAADYTTRVDTSEPGTKNVAIRSEVPGLKELFADAKLKTQITVLGDVEGGEQGGEQGGEITDPHADCQPSGFQKFWNAIVNFFRKLFGKAPICAVCGKEK